MAAKYIVWGTSCIVFENIKAKSILNFRIEVTPFKECSEKRVFKVAMFNFEMKNIIYVPCRVWSA